MIAELIIGVGDLDEGVDFYGTVCGFTHLETVAVAEGRIAVFDAGGVRVTLVQADEPGIRLALRSRDLATDVRRLDRHGVDHPEVTTATGGSWVPFTDPWGTRLGFWNPR